MTEPQFFNSAIIRAPERLLLRGGSWRAISVGVRYGLIIHPQFGPVLIDTGYGPRATQAAERSGTLKLYNAVLRPQLVEDELPLAVLERLGFGARDVQRIVVTHFHADHVAALRDFPNASFIASGAAWARIKAMSALDRLHNGIFLELLPEDFEARLLPIERCAESALPGGLVKGWDIWGDGTCIATDLPGHALGHFGLIWPTLATPLLHAVDTTWLREALDWRLPSGIVRLIYDDDATMRASVEKVRVFRAGGGRVVLCHERVPL